MSMVHGTGCRATSLSELCLDVVVSNQDSNPGYCNSRAVMMPPQVKSIRQFTKRRPQSPALQQQQQVSGTASFSPEAPAPSITIQSGTAPLFTKNPTGAVVSSQQENSPLNLNLRAIEQQSSEVLPNYRVVLLFADYCR